MSYENRSRRLFMEQDPGGSERWGRRALQIATQLGDVDAILNVSDAVLDGSCRGDLPARYAQFPNGGYLPTVLQQICSKCRLWHTPE